MCSECGGGHPCPICGEERRKKECPRCEGYGHIYLDADDIEVIFEEWVTLETRSRKRCPGLCNYGTIYETNQ